MEEVDIYTKQEIEKIIWEVLKKHQDDFNYYEVEEICQDFLDEIPTKIKNITKIKRLKKYINKEFELETIDIPIYNTLNNNWDTINRQFYNLENIPKYLFEWKVKISSTLINIQNLTKYIEQTHLFEQATLKINKKDKIALIWKNGCGKTTLLKMIIGKEENIDWNWKIELAPWITIWYLSQDLFWKSDKNTLKQEMLEVFSEITQKINRYNKIKNNLDLWEEANTLNLELLEIDWYKKYEIQLEILKYFGFSDEQMNFNVLQLSTWEQTKVQIAKFLIMQVDLLILDEPTNHLDIEWIIFLEKFCKNWKKAILSISHDIRFINNTSDKIAEISWKKINNYPWNYEIYLEQKQDRFNKKMKDYTNQQKELDITQSYINRFRANSSKATSVQSRIKQMAKINVLDKPENESIVKAISINSNKRLPETIMKLENIEVWYNVTIVALPELLEVKKIDKIWIIWANWSGKSTLLKTILWELKPLNWIAQINETIEIWSYSQVLEDLNPEISIIKELWANFENETKIRQILWWLLIKWDKVDQKISTLSGWEKAKVALTKMLLTSPDIIIMDEPTNHLDLHSKEVIKKMLDWFNWTTIIVSHDRDLLESVSNKIWLIRDKKMEVFDEVEKWIKEVY